MTTFKSIIARTNGNGELEFIARQYDKPDHRYYLKGNLPISQYDEAVEEWEQSAQVFITASKDEESKILWEYNKKVALNYSEDLKKGIDVTGLVEIREEKRCANRCDWPKCTFNDCMEKHYEEWIKGKNYFAFYKSPSKEEPVKPKYAQPFVNEVIQPVGEEQESQEDMWWDVYEFMLDGILNTGKIPSTEMFATHIQKHFKITRLTKA